MSIINSGIKTLRDKDGRPTLPLTVASAVLLANGRNTESEVSLLRSDVDDLKGKNDSYDQKIEDVKKIVTSNIQSGGAASNRASDLLIDDAGRYYQGLTVESALQENAASIRTLNRVMSSTDVQYNKILAELEAIKKMISNIGSLPPSGGGGGESGGHVPLEGLTLNVTSLSLPEGAFEVLSVTPVPAHASNPSVTWSSSNESVATVNSAGFVTALKVGACLIKATSVEDSSIIATCQLTVASAVASTDYTGLIINQIFGGGSKYDNSQSVSHSFIELYNKTSKAFNLTGLSVQYAAKGADWQKLDLRGSIPAKHSFLIRAGIHADSSSLVTNVFIDEFDQEWKDVRFNNKGMKVVLMANTDLLAVTNPFNVDGKGKKAEGYIDMIGCAGNDAGSSIDGCENRYPATQSKQKSIRRVEFRDTNDNLNDTETIDFRFVYDSYNKVPRHLSHGAWDKEEELDAPEVEAAPFEPLKPNYIINFLGANPATERLITWKTGTQATVGSVILTNKATGETSTIRSGIKTFVNELGSMVRHTARLEGLTPNTEYSYVVRVGVNDSKTYTFRTASDKRYESFSFLHISDTQPTNRAQCQATRDLLDQCESFNADFIFHTGDIVNQTGNKGAGEQAWRDFLHSIEPHLANGAFMACPGNNDLDDGLASINDYLAHFGSPGEKGYYSFVYHNAYFASINIETYDTAQHDWFVQDLASEAAQNAKWRIVCVHRTRYINELDDSPNVVKLTTALEDGNVDLVLQGHKHMYMKSKPIYRGEVNEDRGITYLMCNQSGAVQTSGKKKQWWYDRFMEPMKPAVHKITIENGVLNVQVDCLVDGKLTTLDTFQLIKADEAVAAESIMLSETELTVGTAKTKALTATVIPLVVKDRRVKFTVDNTQIASITDDGSGRCEIFGRSIGTTTITATYVADPSITATCQVTVEDSGEVVKPPHEYLIVNQAYGGNKTNSAETMVSHTFIEIYNTHPTHAVSLEGMSIQASGAGANWKKFNLYGELPAKTSFLLRGIQHNTIEAAKLKIEHYDGQLPDLQLGKGLKAVLMNNTDLLTVPNPFDIDGNGTKAAGYIDMIGVAGNDPGKTIDGYEGAYGSDDTGNSKQRSIRRINFKDTDNNLEDCEICNWDEEFDMHKNKQPRYLAYGPWDANDTFIKK